MADVIQQQAVIQAVIQPPAPITAIIQVGQGPAGPKGADSTGGGAYEHIQGRPASPWIVNHNLGFRPNVAVLTPGGVEVLAEVIHIDTNQVQIYFDEPAVGMALFS